MILQMVIGKIVFQGQMEVDQEAMLYREKLEELQNKDTVLDHEHYLEKITQLFFFRKNCQHATAK